MSEVGGDLYLTISELLQYLKGKGQIYSASEMAVIKAFNSRVKRLFGVDLGLNELVKDWIMLSEIEASRWTTVAQRNVETLTRLGTQVNYIQEQAKTTKYLPLVRRKKQ